MARKQNRLSRKQKARMNELSKFVIDFGRYHGKRLEAIPDDYIEWLASRECQDKSAQWVARQYLAERKKLGLYPIPTKEVVS